MSDTDDLLREALEALETAREHNHGCVMCKRRAREILERAEAAGPPPIPEGRAETIVGGANPWGR